MKYLAILLLVMSGCASLSEYNKGCRDGIKLYSVGNGTFTKDQSSNEEFCNALDKLHQADAHPKSGRP